MVTGNELFGYDAIQLSVEKGIVKIGTINGNLGKLSTNIMSLTGKGIQCKCPPGTYCMIIIGRMSFFATKMQGQFGAYWDEYAGDVGCHPAEGIINIDGLAKMK